MSSPGQSTLSCPGYGLQIPAVAMDPSSWSGSESAGEDIERMSDSADKPMDNDAEGVWSPDIEQSFQEALAIYPPCGRRKIILSDEGKMYVWAGRMRWSKLQEKKSIGHTLLPSGLEFPPRASIKNHSADPRLSAPRTGQLANSNQMLADTRDCRNELIARYIKLRTGKTRTRKQEHTVKNDAISRMGGISSAQIVSATALHNRLGLAGLPRSALTGATGIWQVSTGQPGSSQDVKPFSQQSYPIQTTTAIAGAHGEERCHQQDGRHFFSSDRLCHSPPQPTGTRGTPTIWQVSTGQPGSSQDVKPFSQQSYPIQTTTAIAAYEPATPLAAAMPAWHGRSIGTSKLRLVEFSSFLENQRDPDAQYNKHLFVHIGQTNLSYSDPLLETVDIRQIYDKFPEKKGGLKELFGKGPQNAFFLVKFWADLNCNVQEDSGAFYGVSSQYESSENMTITCSTKVCSFGKQVVEKVETEYARFENGRFVYKINRSPMCEYMINFIHKLKHLPEKYMMNSVLENFTILLVVSNRETQETLLCMACVFEVSNSEHGAQHHIYRLLKD
ncbi:hypothetical protein DNTS_026119 [Danionella cerebrum]|uniref:TEA domain-containing protein n=1 Tax=Danionella cerebrum TaxID=2873325 RepID=A0A553QIS5_9TELE|nr:hypothetical protein DNTS_026119 [Danionella translucida]TRY89831.1 hypothetical protein DNTS_026119 [Danionella translucida]